MGNFVPYRMAEVDEYPSAECLQEGCVFTREPSLGSNDQAKEHVRVTGHKVKVTRSKVSVWRAKQQ